MSGIKIKIEPQIIDWVIRNISEDPEIYETLQKWKQVEPTFKQVKSLSNKIHVPFGYFFLKTPPKEDFEVLEYRTINSVECETPSRNLIDTINYAENVQDWMKNYVIEKGFDKLSFVGSKKGARSEDLVKSIRQYLDIKVNWYTSCFSSRECFKYLRERLENIGILVFKNGIVNSNTHRKLNLSEFRAFTIIDEFAPLIFINANDSQGGQLFSLMHEVAHIWLGIDSFYNAPADTQNVSETEQLCNAAAAEILVPNKEFIFEWNKNIEYDLIKKTNALAKIFRCSSTVIARRAYDNKLISFAEYNEVREKGIEDYNKSKSQNSGGDFYKTTLSKLDNRFLKALNNSVNEGKTLYTDAYRLTNSNRKTFSNLIEVMGANL